MSKLPLEIWREICCLACKDDGTTGRSLGLVSQYVRSVSEEYRYYSIAVAGPRQARGLSEVLKNTPLARVRHLYFVDPRDYVSGLSVVVLPRRTEDIAAINNLLEAVSPTLLSLTIVSHATRQTFNGDHIALHLLQFPLLTELTLRGCYTVPPTELFAPRLVRLHISSEAVNRSLGQSLSKYYPELTHLRISRLMEFISDILGIMEDLTSAMGLRRPPTESQDEWVSTMPTIPRYILIQPGPESWQGSEGRVVLSDPRRRRGMLLPLQLYEWRLKYFTVLPPHVGYGREREAELAKAEWLDRINWGPGCWDSLNVNKPLSL